MARPGDPSHHLEPSPKPGETAPPEGDGNGSAGEDGEPGSKDDAGNALAWQNILGAVAGAAGSAAWVSAVGSAVMGARLENAGMPIESVVSLMPAEQRFAIGVSHLLAPLFVGLLGFLVDWALTAHMSKTTRFDRAKTLGWKQLLFRWSRRRTLAAATILVGALMGVALLEPPSLTLYMLQLAAIVLAVSAVSLFGPARGTRASERGAVFLLVLVLAGVIAFGFERGRDAQFDFAAVRFQDSDETPLAGYYVTTTSAAVLLITLGGESDPDPNRCPETTRLRRISAIPVGDIERVWIGPREVAFDLNDYCEQKEIALAEAVQ